MNHHCRTRSLFTIGTSLLALAVPLMADQWAWMSRDVADNARKMILAVPELRQFCAPCGDSNRTTVLVSAVVVDPIPGRANYYELKVNGKKIDLAYVYVPRNGRWENLATALGLSVANVPTYLTGAPLSRQQIEGLIDVGAPDQTIASEIQERGLAFRPSPADLSRWRGRGGGSKTLTALLARIGLIAGYDGATALRRASGPGTNIMMNEVDRLSYAYVPPGSFLMGCSMDPECDKDGADVPRHNVTITKGFWIGQTEVTVAAYRKYSEEQKAPWPEKISYFFGPRPHLRPSDSHPMVGVSHSAASAYCAWAGGHLPTEAQWEYAATDVGRFNRDSLREFAWYADNSASPDQVDSDGVVKQKGVGALFDWMQAHGATYRVVAQKRPNAFGLYDVLGNLNEWCQDWYSAVYYKDSPSEDPTGPPTGNHRVIRGGGWTDPPSGMGPSRRGAWPPSEQTDMIGFRCVIDELSAPIKAKRPDSGS